MLDRSVLLSLLPFHHQSQGRQHPPYSLVVTQESNGDSASRLHSRQPHLATPQNRPVCLMPGANESGQMQSIKTQSGQCRHVGAKDGCHGYIHARYGIRWRVDAWGDSHRQVHHVGSDAHRKGQLGCRGDAALWQTVSAAGSYGQLRSSFTLLCPSPAPSFPGGICCHVSCFCLRPCLTV